MFFAINSQIKQDSCYFFYKGGDFLNIPKPKKKANGTWIVQVMVDGKRQGKVFDTEKEAIAWAASVKAGITRQKKNPSNLTVGEAIDKYIEDGEAVYSPTTIMGYKKLRRNTMQSIMDIKLSNLTQNDVQKAVNQMVRDGKAPKYIASAHGLLSSVLKKYAPDLRLDTILPAKRKQEIVIPSEEDIQKIISASKGTRSELPVALAVWLGLRASEISGLTWDCIEGDMLHIKQSRVRGEDGLQLKPPKTYSGDRKIHIPAYVKSLLDETPHKNEFVVDAAPHAIYARFSRLCEKNGITHYRFHDLRHYNASVMLANGTPMNYITERLGHSSDLMVKQVYGHIMKSRKEEAAEALENYMESKLQLKLQPDSKK